MPVFLSRRGSQKRTFLSLAGSVAIVPLMALALIFFGAGNRAFADDAESVDVGADSSPPPTLIPGPTWEEANPVLEIPQECNPRESSNPCDARASAAVKDSSSSSDDDDEDDVETAGGGAPSVAPPGDANANSAEASSGDDFAMGGVNDYENQEIEEPPMIASSGWVVAYPMNTNAYPVNTNSAARMNLMAARSPWHFSSPLTSAATPPLNPGPWMSSPMMNFGRPAGGPMMMPGMAFRTR
jgi:hypothetical protein